MNQQTQKHTGKHELWQAVKFTLFSISAGIIMVKNAFLFISLDFYCFFI